MQKPFEITVLGTSSATPTKDRNPSAQYVRLDKHVFLFDCGEGTQNQLLRNQLKLQKVRYVLISHLHGDHYFGLPGLITSMSLFNRTEPLILIGPKSLQSFLNQILDEGGGALSYEIQFIETHPEVSETLVDHEDFSITTVPLKHRIPCTGFVLREKGAIRKINVDACIENGVPVSFYESLKLGLDYISDSGREIENEILTFDIPSLRSFAYISDTIFDPGIVPYIQGVSLLYHESTFMHDRLARAEETFHTTAKQAGMIAAEAGVEQLMLGHYSARYDDLLPLLEEAKEQHENTILGQEGLKLELKGSLNAQVSAF
jgi:ribonuclease Z